MNAYFREDKLGLVILDSNSSVLPIIVNFFYFFSRVVLVSSKTQVNKLAVDGWLKTTTQEVSHERICHRLVRYLLSFHAGDRGLFLSEN